MSFRSRKPVTMTRYVATISLVLTVAACGGGDDTAAPSPTGPGDAEAGKTIYRNTCAACHGIDLTGVTGLGKPLVGSEFVNGTPDAGLVAFLSEGRPIDDPLNTTGIEMPARGGNRSLDDRDLLDVVAFIRDRS